MIIILVTLFVVACFAACAALLTEFTLYLIGDPWLEKVNTKAVFSRVGLWIARKYERADARLQLRKSNHPDPDKYAASHPIVWMSLGACPYCFNAWFTLLFCGAWFLGLGISLWYLILAAPISHWLLGQRIS